MNWKLDFQLSLIGLAMAVGTVFFIPSGVEPVIWLIVFVFCAVVIGKKCGKNFFLNGFFVSLFNCAWITLFHILFHRHYLAIHPREAAMMSNSPLRDSPRLMMLLTGPVIGVLSGLILGAFSWIAGKLLKKKRS
jgi:hypothetical protein